MNSRNYTPEQELLDRLLADDMTALDELTRRYCFSLYNYCIGKLDSAEDAKRIVRNLFISIWEDRHYLPARFSLSLHLYTEVRKAVVQCINNKLMKETDDAVIREKILPGFAVARLREARRPVDMSARQQLRHAAPRLVHKGWDEGWWNRYTPAINLQGLKHALQSMVNFW